MTTKPDTTDLARRSAFVDQFIAARRAADRLQLVARTLTDHERRDATDEALRLIIQENVEGRWP